MSRIARHVSCSKSDIEYLNQLASNASHPRLSQKAKMILMCNEGMQVKDIAAELHERPNTVILWRDRFIENGIRGLGNRPRGIGRVVYGEAFRKRLLAKLDDPPPDGMKHWTGKALSEELQVPLDTIWRYLRESGIHLREVKKQPQQIEIELEVPMKLTLTTEKDDMKENKTSKSENKAKSDIEFIARIKNPDGTVIERKVTMEDAVPQINDFDFSTKDGFLSDFDVYEKAVIKARDQLTNDLTQAYVDSRVKKTTKK